MNKIITRKTLTWAGVIGLVILAGILVTQMNRHNDPEWMKQNSSEPIEVSASPVPVKASSTPPSNNLSDKDWAEIVAECQHVTVASDTMAYLYNAEDGRKVKVGNNPVYRCNGNLFVR